MSTTQITQISLPGQAWVAEGPHDHTGMYLMHFAFRRDLTSFASAIANTPLGAEDTWRALQTRWAVFAEILHHHHSAEDELYWPRLAEATRRRGTAEDQTLIAAMTDEHAGIDPLLTAVEHGFAAVLDHPCDAHRNALDVHLATLREDLDHHLAHEERETLPLVQRVMTAQEYAQVDTATERAYPLTLIPTLIPWVTHRLPAEVVGWVMTASGPLYRVLYRLARPRFERRERAAFRYSNAVLPG